MSPLVIGAAESRTVDGPLWEEIRRDAVLIAGEDPRKVLVAA